MIKWKKAWRTTPFNVKKDCLFQIWEMMMHWHTSAFAMFICNRYLPSIDQGFNAFLEATGAPSRWILALTLFLLKAFFLLVLYKFSRPRCIRNEMESFFGIHKMKIWTGITCMMHALGVQYLDNPVTKITGCHIMLRNLSKMWIDWNCLGIHWWNTLENMSSKLVSKAQV